jgi:hypothetical protein
MASSASKMTPEEIKDLVRSLEAMGQMDAVLIEAQMGRQQVIEGMSDSSKRRLSSADSDPEEFEYISGEQDMPARLSKKQQPIAPKAKGSTGILVPKHVDLPENVESLADWGKTICELPKFARRELSYEDMIKESKHNEGMKEYLDWVYNTGIKSAKADDLRSYLAAVDWKTKRDSQATGITYPGTTMLRRMK